MICIYVFVHIVHMMTYYHSHTKNIENTENRIIKITAISNRASQACCVYEIALQWRHSERDSVSNPRPASRLFAQPFVQAQIKEQIKAPRHRPLWEEFTDHRSIPLQRASNAENISMWWRHMVHMIHVMTFDTIYHVYIVTQASITVRVTSHER